MARCNTSMLFAVFRQTAKQTDLAQLTTHYLVCIYSTQAHPLSTVLGHLENRTTEEIIEDFATVQWSSEAVEKLEHAVRISNISHICITKGYVSGWGISTLRVLHFCVLFFYKDSRSKYRVPEITPNVTITYQPPELCAISGESLTHNQSMTAIFVLMALFHLATSQH